MAPTLQVQSVCSSLPAGALEYAGQSVHAAEPAVSLKVPAEHSAHEPPSGPVEPALQVQAVKAELPAGASEYDGQSKQDESAV